MKEPAERGATTVSGRVIAKIAARAATENHDLVGLPRASATVSGQIATVRLGLTVRYPEPLPPVTARVRDLVRRRVRALTGINVASVDINVDRLQVSEPPAGRLDIGRPAGPPESPGGDEEGAR